MDDSSSDEEVAEATIEQPKKSAEWQFICNAKDDSTDTLFNNQM